MDKFQKYMIKIKGDAGTFNVFQIDWLNMKVFADRTCMGEWIHFDKIKEIIPVEEFKM